MTREEMANEIANIETHLRVMLPAEYLESIGANIGAPFHKRQLHLRCMRIFDDLAERLAAPRPSGEREADEPIPPPRLNQPIIELPFRSPIRAENEKLRAALEAAREALVKAQWGNNEDGLAACNVCDGERDITGHHAWCEVGAVLAGSAPPRDEAPAPPRTPYEDGTCCMWRHAQATPPWTCDCPCHRPVADAPAPVQAECAWTQDEDSGAWDTACGRTWEFTADGPAENRMTYCMGCGRRVRPTGQETPHD